jgi:hypothetical protein
MKRRTMAVLMLLGVWAFLVGDLRVLAITTIGTNSPAAHVVPPTGDLEGSGWQWTGAFNGFCGMPVGQSTFLTAGHIGGKVGDRFQWRGRTYRTSGFESDSGSDLRVWHVVGKFEEVAPVVTEDLVKGDGLVLFGRGRARGAEVWADRGNGLELAGWRWGADDGALRWGTNTVDVLVEGSEVGLKGSVGLCDFDPMAGDDEGTFSVGDSGGGGWVLRDGQWQLASIHYAVEAAYNTSDTGTGMNGCIFDYRGLYRMGDKGWEFVPVEDETPATSVLVVSRIAPRRGWLMAAIGRAPRPAVLKRAGVPEGPYVDFVEALHDPVAREFRLPAGGTAGFFRVSGDAGPQLKGIRLQGNEIVVTYD